MKIIKKVQGLFVLIYGVMLGLSCIFCNSNNNLNLNILSIKLYNLKHCPYCFNVRLAIFFSGIQIEVLNIYDNLKSLNELIDGGGKKQVPCLNIIFVSGKSLWIYESVEIIKIIRRGFMS